jgi:hypothetical protein
MKITVNVTQELVRTGFLRSACGCPVTLAIEAATGARHFSVVTSLTNAIFFVPGKKDRFYPLPAEVQDWIRAFDQADLAGCPEPAPISFELEVDDDIVCSCKAERPCTVHAGRS